MSTPAPEHSGPARAAAAHAARHSVGKLVAFLAARSGDIAGAQDALAGAFESALEAWARDGVPGNPDAWLLTVARRRLIDAARRRDNAAAVAFALDLLGEPAADPADEPPIPDRRLALLFVCAHPAIPEHVRAPLMLQAVLGFEAAEIASAFLVSPAAMSQRLVRAKAKIRIAALPFAMPDRAVLGERVQCVLTAIYAAYANGWTDPLGTEPRRLNLADEALWLGRLLAHLLPGDAEVLGLLALMLYAEARRGARRSDDGGFVPLALQDTARWDGALIDEAESLLRQASALGTVGRYQLEAAVQSAHVVRRHGGRADTAAVALLYEQLQALTGSPVVALNRAVALAQAGDLAAGLAGLDALAAEPRLADYQPHWAARAQLLEMAGRHGDAAAAYERAAGLESDPAVRRYLQDRRAALRR